MNTDLKLKLNYEKWTSYQSKSTLTENPKNQEINDYITDK